MVCVSRGAEAVRLAHGFVQAQQGRCVRDLRQTTHALLSARDTALVHLESGIAVLFTGRAAATLL
jgi:hypothetical protein